MKTSTTYRAPVTFTLTAPTAAFGLRLLAVTTYTWNGRGNLVAAEIDFNYT